MKDLHEYASKIAEGLYDDLRAWWYGGSNKPETPKRGYEGGKVNMNRGSMITPYQDTLKAAGQEQTAMDLRATGPKTSQPGRAPLPNQAALKQQRIDRARQASTDLAATAPARTPPVPQDPMSAAPLGGYKARTIGATSPAEAEAQLAARNAQQRPGYGSDSRSLVASAPMPAMPDASKIKTSGMRDTDAGEAQARAYKQQYLDKYGKKASAFDKQFAAAAVQGKKDFTYTGPKTGKQRDIAVKFKGKTPSYVGKAQQQIKDETK